MSNKVIAVVPARIGSNRIKLKNLRLINGNPLISYCINTLKKCKTVNDIYVNSDSELIGKVAIRYGVKFYKRRKELATSKSMIDEYIYDFLKNVDCDIIAVINPTSPFITSAEIDDAINNFVIHDYDTQLAYEDIKTHCFYNEEAINFSINGKHPRSQDLTPIKALNFAVTLWKKAKFIEQYERMEYGVYTGKIGFYSFHGFSNIDIDWEDDFILAQMIMENIKKYENLTPEYDEVVKDIIDKGISTEN